MERALGEPRPDVFVEVLRECGALAVVLPEVAALFGVPQPEQWHPEIDTGAHLLLALQVAAERGAPLPVRFALLVHDLGKAVTPRERWPSHAGHEGAGVPLVRALCERLRVPVEHRDLGVLVARFHTHVHRGLELRPSTILELLESCDAFRRPDRFVQLLEACECDARGRLGLHDRDYPQRARIEAAQAAASAVALSAEDREGLSGTDIGAKLRERRLGAVTALGSHRKPER
jgi:tRNA nucleotidyltransferase (CCA-adding enzyme)